MKTCIELPELDIKVEQYESKRFKVTYGQDIQTGLTYVAAADHFGQCVFHALACASKLDNEGP